MPDNRPRDGQPNAAERAQLIQGLQRLGYSGQSIARVVQAGRTRQEVANALAVEHKRIRGRVTDG